MCGAKAVSQPGVQKTNNLDKILAPWKEIFMFPPLLMWQI
jgi:hypothetical protein